MKRLKIAGLIVLGTLGFNLNTLYCETSYSQKLYVTTLPLSGKVKACLSGNFTNDKSEDILISDPQQTTAIISRGDNHDIIVKFLPFSPSFMAIADINNDGKNEVIAVRGEKFAAYFFDPSFRRLGILFEYSLQENLNECCYGDIDNDGKSEVVTIQKTNQIYIYGVEKDRLKPKWTFGPLNYKDMKLEIGDFDTDGKNELIMAGKNIMAEKGKNTPIQIWRWDGKKLIFADSFSAENLSKINKNKYGSGGNTRIMQMKVVDTNGDGKNEFIVETETWYGEGMMGDPYSISGISVFSHDKELIWHSPDFSTNFLIGDINGNNLPEIICSTRDNKANSIELLEWDGNTYQKKWTFEANLSPLSIVNLEDGKKEVMAIGNSDLFLIFSEERK